MQRLAFKMHLKEGQKEEFIKKQSNVWPELKQHLKGLGISEYSIFLDQDTNTLYAFQKVNGIFGSQDIGASGIVKRWWKEMSTVMESNKDNSPVSKELEEVFYME